jgi:malonyl-CoA/methylmalonyl-CoA synthetase
VVAKPGAQVETTALMASLKGVIANYKVPKQIHLLEALPRNVRGKVQKNLLRDQFSRA